MSLEDKVLEEAIQKALGLTGAISIENALELTALSADNLTITSLVGLEVFSNLTSLSLKDNLISDLSPLSGMKALEILDIGGNQIMDLSPLSKMPSLKRLDISKNLFYDPSVLRSLNSLTELECNADGDYKDFIMLEQGIADEPPHSFEISDEEVFLSYDKSPPSVSTDVYGENKDVLTLNHPSNARLMEEHFLRYYFWASGEAYMVPLFYEEQERIRLYVLNTDAIRILLPHIKRDRETGNLKISVTDVNNDGSNDIVFLTENRDSLGNVYLFPEVFIQKDQNFYGNPKLDQAIFYNGYTKDMRDAVLFAADHYRLYE